MSDTTKARVATVWLGGCSGCHMSFLDMDEFLFDVAQLADVVYSPLVDTKEIPDDIDVFLLEGAIANTDNLEIAREARLAAEQAPGVAPLWLAAGTACAVPGPNGTCRRVTFPAALENVRMVSQHRERLGDLKRDCRPDPLIEADETGKPRRFCFVTARY